MGSTIFEQNLSQAVATNTFLAINDNNFLGFRDMRAVVVKILHFIHFRALSPPVFSPLFKEKRPFSQAVATNMFLAINDTNSLGFRDMRALMVKILQFYPF